MASEARAIASAQVRGSDVRTCALAIARASETMLLTRLFASHNAYFQLRVSNTYKLRCKRRYQAHYLMCLTIKKCHIFVANLRDFKISNKLPRVIHYLINQREMLAIHLHSALELKIGNRWLLDKRWFLS